MEHADLLVLSSSRLSSMPLNNWKIQPSNYSCFGLQHVLAKSMKLHFHMKNNYCGHCPKCTKHYTFWILNLSQYRKKGSTFWKASLLLPLTFTKKRPVFVLALPMRQSWAKAAKIGHWFCSQTLDCLLEQPLGMDKVFCPLLEKLCPLFKYFAQFWSILPRQ